METKIITISREFGSGGRTIGKSVADRLGIPFYDKKLVQQVALETGFDPQFVEDQGETAPGNTSYSYSLLSQGMSGAMKGLSVSDFLWCMQRDVILQIAEKESCVIVGRCADYILKDRDDCLHAFIHASPEFRADRIVRLYGESEKSPEKRLYDKDKKRKVNYKHYTGRAWGKPQNYHIALNSGLIGIDRCADILVKLASMKRK